MTMYHQDPDVLRWGLHLLDVCSISNAGSCGSVTHYDPDLSNVEYVREGYVGAEQPGHVGAEQPSVENDELIAHAFREEHLLLGLEQPGYIEAEQRSVENDELIAHAFREEHLPLGLEQPGYVEAEQPSVDNDGPLALAYQEELSQLALEEASGVSTSGNEQLRASVLTQDWHAPSKRYSDAEGRENGQQLEHRKDVGKAYSFSSPGAKSGSDYDVDMLHVADESVLDGEVGKRLNQMVPVPHVPKINGDIPSVEDEVSDHQRLLDRLQLYDLVENKVQGDGNCQFRALSDQLYRSPKHHEFVRQQIVQQLKSCPQKYDGFVPMAFEDYLEKMSESGEWGDAVTLQAAADSYGVKIFLITSIKDMCYIEILPHISKSKRVIFLSFWAEVHYNSIYPEGELPYLSDHKKKPWWCVF